MFLKQLIESEDKVAIMFGRFNPPHEGHKEAWETVSTFDKWYIGTNKDTIGKNDPLPFDVKVQAMKTVWPGIVDHLVVERNWLTMASMVYERHGPVTLVCCTDEAWIVPALLKYNGIKNAHGLYKFKKIVKHETPRITSASLLRKAVVEGNRDEFVKISGVPANVLIAGKPYFDLVAEYLLPYYAPKVKKINKKIQKEKPRKFESSNKCLPLGEGWETEIHTLVKLLEKKS